MMLTPLVISYLFLGGTGAGMCFVLACMSLLVPARSVVPDGERGTFAPISQYRPLFGAGFLVAAAVLVLACLCLLFDMRRPDAVLTLVTRPTITVVSVGAYSIAVDLAACVFLALCWLSSLKPSLTCVRVVSVLAMVFALLTAGYTGVLLSFFATAPFWQTPLVTAVFVVSSLSCGIAGVVCMSIASQAWDSFSEHLERLLVIDRAAIVLEAVLLSAFVVICVHSYRSYGMELVAGDLAWVFWLCVVVGGLLLPLTLNVLRGARVLDIHPGIVAILVLGGGFALRWCIVMAA